MTTQELIKAINTICLDWMMIDNNREYFYHSNLNDQINAAIPTLTKDQATEVYESMAEWRKQYEHGQMLLSVINAPEPTPTTPTGNAINKVALFQNAWAMFKAGLFTSFAQSLKAAWSRLKVVTKMKVGACNFQYIKADGTIRTATGTLTGLQYQAKTTESKPKPEIIKYFDIEAQGFRSFRIDRFIGLVA